MKKRGWPKGKPRKVKLDQLAEAIAPKEKAVTVTIKALDSGYLLVNGRTIAYSTWDEVADQILSQLEK